MDHTWRRLESSPSIRFPAAEVGGRVEWPSAIFVARKMEEIKTIQIKPCLSIKYFCKLIFFYLIILFNSVGIGQHYYFFFLMHL